MVEAEKKDLLSKAIFEVIFCVHITYMLFKWLYQSHLDSLER